MDGPHPRKLNDDNDQTLTNLHSLDPTKIVKNSQNCNLEGMRPPLYGKYTTTLQLYYLISKHR